LTPDVAERWRQADALFQQALALPAADRPALLDAACGHDPELRAEVEGLLAALDDADAFLEERPEWPALADGPGAFTEEPAPERIGPYRVLGELGRGGMGVVYHGERADGQFRQRVAIKTIRAGLAGSAAAERFRQERALLARLEHPGITRLLDGGLDAAGRPWLAMEYVEGEPITTYADRRKLPVDARLRLFCAACGAVHYAHQRLVVHRDLKPTNVLVGEDDAGRPVVKLLDFGIATLLEGGADGALGPLSLIETQAGARLLTPAYAAPEQIRGEAVTTATDVYALGVLLYELLAGRRPYRATTRSVFEAERAAVEEEAERPSAAVGRVEEGGPGAEALAALRGTNEARLRRRLAGDLDAVVLKALRKEPEQRYASAEALAEDVGRHLDGLPVRARKGTAAYRFVRFVRRNRVGVAAAGLVVLALAGGLGASLYQADKAEREAAKATAVSDFLEKMFSASSPTNGQGRDATVAAALDSAAVRLDAGGEPPEVEAAVRMALGRTYRDLGLYDEAEPHFLRAVALRERVNGPASNEASRAINGLAILRLRQGRAAESAALLRRTITLDRQNLGPRHPEVAVGLINLVDALIAEGDYDASETAAREGIAILRRVVTEGGPGDPTEHRLYLSTAINNLAGALYFRGDFAEAGRLFEESNALDRRMSGERHPDVAIGLNNIAAVRRVEGRYAEADSLYRRALAIRRAGLGTRHPDVAFQLTKLGDVLVEQRRLGEAEAAYQEALAIRRDLLGPRHPDLAPTLEGLGTVRAERGDFAAAEGVLRQALGLAREGLGDTHPATGRISAVLARTLHALDRPADAERLYREAAAVLREAQPQHPSTAIALAGLGALLVETGRAPEAEGLLRDALAITRRVPGGRRLTAEAESALGAALLAGGRRAEAVPLLRRSYAALARALGADALETRRARARLDAAAAAGSTPRPG
jgi:serine/threonine protein kinase/Tfp pilus assembly protein PilF